MKYFLLIFATPISRIFPLNTHLSNTILSQAITAIKYGVLQGGPVRRRQELLDLGPLFGTFAAGGGLTASP